jgi:hypothetical protein
MFQHIASGITFDWNFDDLVDQLSDDIYYGDNIPPDMHDKANSAYFQSFYSKVSTSTNFGTFFPREAQDVIDKIAQLQENIRQQVKEGSLESNELIQLLLHKELKVKDVLFLRLDASEGSSVHIDRRRSKALNIGFQNSNTCTTYVRPGKELDGFFDDFSKLKAFTMNDGDAYLLDVGQAHAVRSNVPELKGMKRYIISHNLEYYQ